MAEHAAIADFVRERDFLSSQQTEPEASTESHTLYR